MLVIVFGGVFLGERVTQRSRAWNGRFGWEMAGTFLAAEVSVALALFNLDKQIKRREQALDKGRTRELRERERKNAYQNMEPAATQSR